MWRHLGILAGLALFLIGCGSTLDVPDKSPVFENRTKSFTVIAHRGASGYLPEHTLAGTAMAHVMGVDYIEQDVVLTRDDELIVLHDLYLDAVTNVAKRYQERQREDGHRHGLKVHAYTLRADQLPDAIETIDDVMYALREQLGLDGLFTDHAGQVIRYLQGGT